MWIFGLIYELNNLKPHFIFNVTIIYSLIKTIKIVRAGKKNYYTNVMLMWFARKLLVTIQRYGCILHIIFIFFMNTIKTLEQFNYNIFSRYHIIKGKTPNLKKSYHIYRYTTHFLNITFVLCLYHKKPLQVDT